MANHILNTNGLHCPIPIIKTRKTLKGMAVGDTLVISTTDPGATADFVAFCEYSGHDLLSSTSDAGVFSFEIRKN